MTKFPVKSEEERGATPFPAFPQRPAIVPQQGAPTDADVAPKREAVSLKQEPRTVFPPFPVRPRKPGLASLFSGFGVSPQVTAAARGIIYAAAFAGLSALSADISKFTGPTAVFIIPAGLYATRFAEGYLDTWIGKSGD